MGYISEIRIPGIGTVRPLTDLGLAKLRRCHGREQRHLLYQALALGVSLKTFKRLVPAQQDQVWRAVCALTSPRNI